MSKEFFAGARPGQSATFGKATFDLPILYYRDDFFALFFTASFEKIKAAMPSPNLHPVRAGRDRAMLGVGAYNYIDTTIGPYGEIGVVIPVVYGRKPLPFLPALLEARWPNFGLLVMHLPVTRIEARDAGRGQWGYTKFMADMHFTITPEYNEVKMDEEGQHILTMRVMKRGVIFRDTKPLVTYSVKDRNLIKTTVAQRGTCKKCMMTSGSFLTLGHHPVADSIRAMEISSSPMQSRYYMERSGILPAGEVIETNVNPLEGYYGKDRSAQHTTSFLSYGG